MQFLVPKPTYRYTCLLTHGAYMYLGRIVTWATMFTVVMYCCVGIAGTLAVGMLEEVA